MIPPFAEALEKLLDQYTDTHDPMELVQAMLAAVDDLEEFARQTEGAGQR